MKTMNCCKRLIIIFTVAFVLLSTAHAVYSKPLEATTPLFHMLNILAEKPAFSMKFHQEIKNNTSGQTIHANGTVCIEKPNKFRWDYKSTPSNIITCNGESLMMLLPEDKQAMIEQYNNIVWSPFSILLDPDKLNTEFRIENIKSDTEDLKQFQLIPIAKNSRYEYLVLKFNPDLSPFCFSMVIFDLAANENVLEFSELHSISSNINYYPSVPEGFQITDFSGQPILLSDILDGKNNGALK